MNELITALNKDPFANMLGIKVESVEKGSARCSVIVTGGMLNFLGFVHGGLIFSLADVAFSAASNSDFSPSFALDVSGSFFKTAAVGDTITAEARLLHTTKRTGVYRMEVLLNGDPIATFNGTVFRKA